MDSDSNTIIEPRMKSAFKNISELVSSSQNFISIILDEKEKISVERLIYLNSSKEERVQEDSEVRCYLQKYLVNNSNQDLIVVNKDFKNISTKKISGMTNSEIIFRKLLLTICSDQIIAFKIPSTLEKKNYDDAILKLPNYLKNNNYESYFIYVIGVFQVYNLIKEPASINQYEKYFKDVYSQVTYLIEKRDFGRVISNINKIISFYILNKKTVAELNSKKQIKEKCDIFLEKLLSNKIYSIIEKESQEKNKDYESAIKSIDEEYCKYFVIKKNANSKIYSKNLGRKCRCYVKLRNLEKSKEALQKIKDLFPDNEELLNTVKKEVDDLEKSIKTKENRKNLNFKKNLTQFLSIEDQNSAFDQWDVGTLNINLAPKIDLGIIEYDFSN